MAVRGGVCPAVLPAERQLLLRAAQPREHSDRRWQIRHASCKALAARDKEPAPTPLETQSAFHRRDQLKIVPGVQLELCSVPSQSRFEQQHFSYFSITRAAGDSEKGCYRLQLLKLLSP